MDKDTLGAILNAITAPVVMEGISDGRKFAILPESMKVEDLTPFIGQPDWIQQKIEALAANSFCAYVKRFGMLATTVIFANESVAIYEAVLDYHEHPEYKRNNCSHIVVYGCPQSDQWKAWTSTSGKQMSQEDFSAFLEANLREIVKPAGADMLQIALNLQVHKSAQFESGIRTDNGEVQFRYTEQIKGTSNTRAGDLKIPVTFELYLPVFVDGAPLKIEARFKYRMTEGKLSLGYELIRPADAFRAAVKQVTADISKGCLGFQMYLGVRR